MRLTKGAINELKSVGSDIVVWDDAMPGFGVRVKPTGIKSYVLQYRNRHGRSKRLTLGRVGQITLDQARREATKLKGGVSLGNDPALDRRAAREGDTLKDLSTRYMEEHCRGRCKPSTITAHN